MCVLSIKVPIRKKSGNVSYAPRMSHDLTIFSISLLIPLQYKLFLAFNQHFSMSRCASWILFRTMLCMLFGITMHSPFVTYPFCTDRHSFSDQYSFYGFRNVFFSIFNSSSSSCKSACFYAHMLTLCIYFGRVLFPHFVLAVSSISSLGLSCLFLVCIRFLHHIVAVLGTSFVVLGWQSNIFILNVL